MTQDHPNDYLLVGSHFRPPAKQLIAALPVGYPLVLESESENPYDAEAIRVMVDISPDSFSDEIIEGIENSLLGTGYTFGELVDASPIHLGYIAKTGGKPAMDSGTHGNKELKLRLMAEGRELEGLVGHLGYTPDGKPTFRLPDTNGSPTTNEDLRENDPLANHYGDETA